jgi:hypothetical protein
VLAGQTDQCSATVQETSSFSTAVTWSTDSYEGAPEYGTISASGLFTAPNSLGTVVITATSVEDPTKSGSTTITVKANCVSGGPPSISLNATEVSFLVGYTCNVDTTKTKVVIYALTNQWYVQPFVSSPFTDIQSDGTWASTTHGWNALVALLVDPANYTPAAIEITNPALDPNVIAWTMYPPGPVSVNFSNRRWGIKLTGNAQSDQFDPGPNFWSNDPSVLFVAADGSLHLNITEINGVWECGEIYLLESLGYGTYTMQIASPLDMLDLNTVAAPMFIYATTSQEFDNEYSGVGGLIPSPYDAQFVVQPYTVTGNIVRYSQPSNSQFTVQMDWRADHVTFTSWTGWQSAPSSGDIIYQWTYTGPYNFIPGGERVHINLWLLDGAAPTSGIGDTLIINSFSFQP